MDALTQEREIGVTPAMIEAGVVILDLYSSSYSRDSLVAEVYRAMAAKDQSRLPDVAACARVLRESGLLKPEVERLAEALAWECLHPDAAA